MTRKASICKNGTKLDLFGSDLAVTMFGRLESGAIKIVWLATEADTVSTVQLCGCVISDHIWSYKILLASLRHKQRMFFVSSTYVSARSHQYCPWSLVFHAHEQTFSVYMRGTFSQTMLIFVPLLWIYFYTKATVRACLSLVFPVQRPCLCVLHYTVSLSLDE